MIDDVKKQCVIARSIRGDEDFRLVRNLLIETHALSPPGFNWDIRRWDGSHFYNETPGWNPRWEKFKDRGVRLWETREGRLVGAVHPEGGGDAFLELRPDYRHIEEDMLAWAEEHLPVPTEDAARRRLDIFAYEYDSPRLRLLERRGYRKLNSGGAIRKWRLGNNPLPRPAMPDGYVLRTVRPGDQNDCLGLADLYNAAFNRTSHTAGEYAAFAANSPSYRGDLELVAEAPDGTIAAMVGMILEEINGYGLFEPVCTHPRHLRRGLAGTLMFEDLNRVRALGATHVYVESGDQVAANKLYESVGFPEAYRGYIWRKVI